MNGAAQVVAYKGAMRRRTPEASIVSLQRCLSGLLVLAVGASMYLGRIAAADDASGQLDTCGGSLPIVPEHELPAAVRGFHASGLIGSGSIWTSPRSLTTEPGYNETTGEYRLKMPWFRTKPGRLKLTGKRVEGAGRFRAETAKPGEYPSTGFEPSALMFSRTGCWKITARHRQSTFAFHIQIAPTA